LDVATRAEAARAPEGDVKKLLMILAAVIVVGVAAYFGIGGSVGLVEAT
jgi:hypothetical protein